MKAEAFTVERIAPTPTPPFFHIDGNWSQMLPTLVARHGLMKCDEEAPLQRGELDVGPTEQVRLVDPAAGTVRLALWTPNALSIEADMVHEDVVLLNENWNEHWQVASGPATIVNMKGRLAYTAPAGKSAVVLRYRPRTFVVGAAVSALAMPGAAILFLLAAARRRRAPTAAAPPAV